jgi:signal transduction histidine kinase
VLAGWLTRSIRQLEATQAPYEAAHRLVGQLHLLTREVPMGLDGHSLGRELLDRARIAALATRASLLVRSRDDALVPLVSHGQAEPEDEAVACASLLRCAPAHAAGVTALPLQVGDHTFAVLVLAGEEVAAHIQEVQELLDGLAVQLETALLFDEVRSLATSEERKRLARDIHDGIAQRIVVVGYLIDELAECTQDVETRRAAEALRLEVSRVIIELRSSVFDLRHGENEADGLSGALTEYVREVATLSGLQVHLRLDISGSALSRRTEGELLGVVEEAVANVRKHADATNLWVSLTTNGRHIRLQIEDDGAGLPAERPGHYGLNTMRDRARRVNADLTITDRSDGGTIVALQTRPASATTEGDPHVDSRPSRR